MVVVEASEGWGWEVEVEATVDTVGTMVAAEEEAGAVEAAEAVMAALAAVEVVDSVAEAAEAEAAAAARVARAPGRLDVPELPGQRPRVEKRVLPLPDAQAGWRWWWRWRWRREYAGRGDAGYVV